MPWSGAWAGIARVRRRALFRTVMPRLDRHAPGSPAPAAAPAAAVSPDLADAATSGVDVLAWAVIENGVGVASDGRGVRQWPGGAG